MINICELCAGYVRLWDSSKRPVDCCFLIKVNVLSFRFAAKVYFWRACQEKVKSKKQFQLSFFFGFLVLIALHRQHIL